MTKLIGIILRFRNCNRFILWPSIILRRAHSHFCDGILALVGSSPMGRRLLRSILCSGTSFIFVSLGLVSRRTATVATITEAALFLIGGIPGTFHHLYFAGATTQLLL